MKIYKNIVLLLILASIITGCGSSSNTSSTGLDSRKDEFISLTQRVTYEYGSVTIDAKEATLAFTGGLVLKDETSGEITDYLGIGIFNEENTTPVVVMSSDDGEMPNFETMLVNQFDTDDSYECTDISHMEQDSPMIKEHKIIMVNGYNCINIKDSSKDPKNIKIKLTQSIFSGGTSKLEVEDNKAYLNTDYQLKNNLYIMGGLGSRAYNQIFDLMQSDLNITTLVEQNISGSIHDDINMQTGRLVRQSGLSTHLENGSHIASGGVDLFCAGVQRTIEEGAKLGVHSWSGEDIEAGELPEESPLHNNQINYFNEMLGDPLGKEFYFFTIYAASADDMYYMNENEIEQYGISTH
jgi:hypothetical protein